MTNISVIGGKLTATLKQYIIHLSITHYRYMFVERGMKGKKKFKPNPDLKLMDQVREVLRYHHYAYRTDRTQGEWEDGCEVK
jgi:hypothetical protein